jgi:hypothetical protein
MAERLPLDLVEKTFVTIGLAAALPWVTIACEA